jgi:hypothetical protein
MLSPLLLGLGLLQATADVAQAGFGLVIASDSDCPSAAAIRDELGSLKYPTPDAASVAIHADEDRVSITFGAPGGVQRGPRELALPPECPRRASTVALLIAAWLGRIPSGSPAASLTLVAEPPPLQPAPAAPPGEQAEVGAGLSAYVQAGHLIPALRVEFATGTEESGPGWQLGAIFPAPVEETIVGGGIAWMRPALMALRRLRRTAPGATLDATVGALLGLTLAWGRGYSMPRHDYGLAAGGTVGLRLCGSSRGLGPWIELRGRGWLVEQELAWVGRNSYGASVTLPVMEMELTFGASLPL